MNNNWDRVRLRIETVKEMLSPSSSSNNATDVPPVRTISTHILDTSLGRAASNIHVQLYRQTQHGDGQWQLVGEGVTDGNGRINTLLATQVEFISGIYKLHFNVQSYYDATTTLEKRQSFYPFIDIIVQCEQGEHYHVPLLLNPFGYSTYRGT